MTATPQTPETVQELLDRQEQKEEVNMLQLGLRALLECSAEENAQVAEVILETLRDWHMQESRNPENQNPTAWLVDAARLDVALKTLQLVRCD